MRGHGFGQASAPILERDQRATRAGQALRPSTTAWVSVGFALAVVLAGAAIVGLGLGRTGIVLGLRLTARLAFVLFWPCYVGGALVALFGPRFLPIKRRARDLGLAFAAVLAVHLGLVAALCAIGHAPSVQVFIVFGPGVACAALLALASIESVGRAIGDTGWWVLRNIAMNYLAFDFAFDFVRRQDLNTVAQQVAYLPFAALAIVGPTLRLLAWLKVRMAPLGAKS